jgi:hypothetical protein
MMVPPDLFAGRSALDNPRGVVSACASRSAGRRTGGRGGAGSRPRQLVLFSPRCGRISTPWRSASPPSSAAVAGDSISKYRPATKLNGSSAAASASASNRGCQRPREHDRWRRLTGWPRPSDFHHDTESCDGFGF